MPRSAVLLCKQDEVSLACHCNHTYGFLGLDTALHQPSTDPQLPCLGPCACLLQQCCYASKMKTALLVTAFTPMGFFWTSYRSAATQQQVHSDHAQDPVHAPLSSAALQSKLKSALLVTAIAPRVFWTSYSSAAIQHRSTATIPRTLCMPAAAVLLYKASCRKPCL